METGDGDGDDGPKRTKLLPTEKSWTGECQELDGVVSFGDGGKGSDRALGIGRGTGIMGKEPPRRKKVLGAGCVNQQSNKDGYKSRIFCEAG